MLTIFASQNLRPEIEAVDRDPGIVSLISAIVRFARRGSESALARGRDYRRVANEAELFSSSSAWPHHHNAR